MHSTRNKQDILPALWRHVHCYRDFYLWTNPTSKTESLYITYKRKYKL